MTSVELNIEQKRLDSLAQGYRYWPSTPVAVFTAANDASVDVVRQRRDYGEAAYYAIINGKPVGYVVGHHVDRHLSAIHEPVRYRRRARFIITSLFVAPVHRGIGIASGLYSSIIKSGVILVSDWDRNDGSNALWCSLQDRLPRRTVASFSGLYIGRFPRLVQWSGKDDPICTCSRITP